MSHHESIWAVAFGRKICNPWENFHRIQLQGWGFLIFLIFLYCSLKIEKIKNVIAKNTKNWAAIFGGNICNPWEYSDSPQLQRSDLQDLNIFWKKNWKKSSKKSYWNLKIIKNGIYSNLQVLWPILKRRKTGHILDTESIWAVTFGYKT